MREFEKKLRYYTIRYKKIELAMRERYAQSKILNKKSTLFEREKTQLARH